MDRQEHVFMIDNNLRELMYFCGNDECYKAEFMTNDYETFCFKLSRDEVVEDMKQNCRYVKDYENNKDVIVAYFHSMAKRWFIKLINNSKVYGE